MSRTHRLVLLVFLGGCTGHITGGGDDDAPPVITPGVRCDDERPVARQLRLLTRLEYQRTVRDLLGVDVDTALLPVEPRVNGFDNNGQAAVVTSRHLDAYIAVAEDAVDRALATRRAELIGCDPAAAGCARQYVERQGARIFRRPLAEDELTAYSAAFDGQAFDDGVRIATGAMMIAPAFLYRSEIGDAAGQRATLTPYEVASALSYLFLGTMPDQALFDAARDGQLASAEQRMAQARRLLADPRARDQVADFVGQWLRTDGINANKDGSIYPLFSNALREAMIEEERRFVAHVVFDLDGTYQDLFTADYAMIDATLADFYGLPRPTTGWAPVPVTAESGRGGLLGLGTVLASHAHSNESSPIKRGVFVRNRILCQDLVPPPPGVDTTPPGLDPTLTTRERFAQHTADPACSGCHTLIDGIGFGLEGFDGIGGRRLTENGRPVDLSGDVVGLDGVASNPFNDVQELSSLLADSEGAQQCLPLQYFRFARGVDDDEYDACAIHNLQLTFADSGLSIQEMLVAIVGQPSFDSRKP